MTHNSKLITHHFTGAHNENKILVTRRIAV
jgi:hypothetical protein